MKNSSKFKYNIILSMIPVAILLIICPLMVHANLVQTYLEEYNWFPLQGRRYDFFMYLRSQVSMIVSVVMLIILLFQVFVSKKWYIPFKLIWPLMIYVCLVIISTVLSVNYTISLKGMIESYETLWALLGYVIIYCFFFCLSNNYYSVRMAIGCLLIGGSIQCLIGLSQLLRNDFWASDVGTGIITAFSGLEGMLRFNFNTGENIKLYLSFYNPNYAAVYIVMLLPIAVCISITSRKNWIFIVNGVLSIGLSVCLLGTKSKAGLFTIMIQIIVLGSLIAYYGKRKKELILIGITIFAIFVVAATVFPGESVFEKLKNSIFQGKKEYELTYFETNTDGVHMGFKDHDYFFCVSNKGDLKVIDENGEQCKLISDENGDYKLKKYKKKSLKFNSAYTSSTRNITIYWKTIKWEFVSENGQKFEYINLAGNKDQIENTVGLFGKGYERLLSGRIYIWSRSVPLLCKYILKGSGPDTFAMIFPQNDYVGKANTGKWMIGQILTRPHNFYLQMALQTGLLSLLSFLYFCGREVYRFLRRYGNYQIHGTKLTQEYLVEMALFTSLIGFLFMGISNDSVIVTTPIFWAIFGMFSNQSWLPKRRHS